MKWFHNFASPHNTGIRSTGRNQDILLMLICKNCLQISVGDTENRLRSDKSINYTKIHEKLKVI